MLLNAPGWIYIVTNTMATQTHSTLVTFWNGVVMGGGVGMSCHARFIIATENTLYAMPETSIGNINDASLTYLFSRIKGNPSIGLYIGLTGKRLRGKECVTWGVATHFVPKDKLDLLR